METLKDRQLALESAVDETIRQYVLWSRTPQDTIAPSDPIWYASDAMVKMFEFGTIPAACRRLARAVEDFSRFWVPLTTDAEINPDGMIHADQGLSNCMNALSDVREGTKPLTNAVVENMEEYLKSETPTSRISDEQLAKAFNLRTEAGDWDLSAARLARRDPKKWDAVNYEQFLANRNARLMAERLGGPAQEMLEAHQAVADKLVKPEAPESVEDLGIQQVPVHFIAKMKGISEIEVRQILENAGIEPTIANPSPLQSVLSDDQQRRVENSLNSREETMHREQNAAMQISGEADLDERIITMYEQQGMEPERIARAQGITVERVMQTLGQFA